MLNQIVLVGNIKSIAYNKKNKQGSLYLEVKRFTKNDSGEYETDMFEVRTSNDITKKISDYSSIGDLIGIRGCLKTDNNKIYISGDKITLLTSKKGKENEGE